jgi:hypothetical protein
VKALLANEATYPTRVVRAEPSEADRALGFAGPITSLDLTSVNIGRTRVDSIDLAATQAVEIGTSTVEAYLRGTWEPTFRTRASDTSAWIERVGFRDGPLRWRGNAGLDWTQGRLTLGVNAQVYARYRVAFSYDNAQAAAQQAREQGSSVHSGTGLCRPVGRRPPGTRTVRAGRRGRRYAGACSTCSTTGRPWWSIQATRATATMATRAAAASS